MKPMKTNDAIALLVDNGFIQLRSNGHVIYGRGIVRIALSHDRMVSPGVMRKLLQAIKQAKSIG